MLLHAKRFWPEAITTMLWPFVLLAYIERRNNLQLDSNNQTPLQKICKLGKKLDITKFYTWGCPVFVLESQIQTDPKGLPKWNPRARVGIYLGHSPVHAGNVALVLNPATGHVSPQFHLVFDDDFTTVESMRNGTVPQNWCELVSKSSERATAEDFNLSNTWFKQNIHDPDDPTTGNAEMLDNNTHWTSNESKQGLDYPLPSQNTEPHSTEASKLDQSTNSTKHSSLVSEGDDLPLSEVAKISKVPVDSQIPKRSKKKVKLNNLPKSGTEDDILSDLLNNYKVSLKVKDDNLKPKYLNLETQGLRRSKQLKPKEEPEVSDDGYLIYSYMSSTLIKPNVSLPSTKNISTSIAKFIYYIETADKLFDNTLNELNIFALAAKYEENKTYTYNAMLKQKDKDQFFKAMEKEIADHSSRNHWSVMRTSELPPKAKIIMAIWSFKRKRLPDGTLLKHKARLCAHSGQ